MTRAAARSLSCEAVNAPPRMSREEERRPNVRTLIFASIGSATAALVTSRLWIAGTWIAAAMTPVIVTLVSELLQRPTERIARGITTDRPALTPDEAAPEPGRAPEAAAAQRVAARLREDVTRPLPDPDAPVPGQPGGAGPTRVYRSGAAPARRRRKIAFNVVFGTAALAFVIGALALTVPELIAGGSLAGNDRRTTLGGGKQSDSADRDTQPPDREAPTDEQEQPPPPTEEQPPPEEEPTTPETETETTPTPVPGEETVPPGEPLPPTDTTTP